MADPNKMIKKVVDPFELKEKFFGKGKGPSKSNDSKTLSLDPVRSALAPKPKSSAAKKKQSIVAPFATQPNEYRKG